MLNITALQGRLVADPELRHTPNGVAACSFRLAVERSFAKQGEERTADFIDIVAWRQTAEFVSKYFAKGGMLLVHGSIQTRRYEDKSGNKRTAFEVVASGVDFCGGAEHSTQPRAPAAPKQGGFLPAVGAPDIAADTFTPLDGDLPF